MPFELQEEADGSNVYNQYQPGSLNTTKQIVDDLKNIDIVFHIGDIVYANGYLSQWDQFTSQVEQITSRVPYMIARYFADLLQFISSLFSFLFFMWLMKEFSPSGNHERDWPDSGSFYGKKDSGGECGVLAQTMFYFPAENRDKFWYGYRIF